MPKFTAAESTLIKSIVASISIKRIPEPEIINEIYNQTNKTISKVALFNIKKRIKRDSYHWYKTMRNGEFEYVHEFRERVSEIMAELHRLSITLSNLFDVAPTIINGTIAVPTTSETKAVPSTDIIV